MFHYQLLFFCLTAMALAIPIDDGFGNSINSDLDKDGVFNLNEAIDLVLETETPKKAIEQTLLSTTTPSYYTENVSKNDNQNHSSTPKASHLIVDKLPQNRRMEPTTMHLSTNDSNHLTSTTEHYSSSKSSTHYPDHSSSKTSTTTVRPTTHQTTTMSPETHSTTSSTPSSSITSSSTTHHTWSPKTHKTTTRTTTTTTSTTTTPKPSTTTETSNNGSGQLFTNILLIVNIILIQFYFF